MYPQISLMSSEPGIQQFTVRDTGYASRGRSRLKQFIARMLGHAANDGEFSSLGLQRANIDLTEGTSLLHYSSIINSGTPSSTTPTISNKTPAPELEHAPSPPLPFYTADSAPMVANSSREFPFWHNTPTYLVSARRAHHQPRSIHTVQTTKW